MKVTKALEGKQLTVSIEGRLDTLTAPELERELKPAMEGIDTLVFDLMDLAYISSAGLRVLISAAQAMTRQGGSMTVVNSSSDVRNIFEITGLTDILGIV